jgi:hypothetical protein
MLGLLLARVGREPPVETCSALPLWHGGGRACKVKTMVMVMMMIVLMLLIHTIPRNRICSLTVSNRFKRLVEVPPKKGMPTCYMLQFVS